MSRLPAPIIDPAYPQDTPTDAINAALLLAFACIMFVVGALAGAWLCL